MPIVVCYLCVFFLICVAGLCAALICEGVASLREWRGLRDADDTAVAVAELIVRQAYAQAVRAGEVDA